MGSTVALTSSSSQSCAGSILQDVDLKEGAGHVFCMRPQERVQQDSTCWNAPPVQMPHQNLQMTKTTSRCLLCFEEEPHMASRTQIAQGQVMDHSSSDA